VKILLIFIRFFYEDPNQGYVKVEFTAPMAPNKAKVEGPVPSERSMSDYCRFAQTVLFMPHMEGFDADLYVRVEQVDGGSSDGPQEQFVLYTDNAL